MKMAVVSLLLGFTVLLSSPAGAWDDSIPDPWGRHGDAQVNMTINSGNLNARQRRALTWEAGRSGGLSFDDRLSIHRGEATVTLPGSPGDVRNRAFQWHLDELGR